MIKKGNKRIIITLTPLEQKALEELMSETEESASKLISRLIRQEAEKYMGASIKNLIDELKKRIV